MSQTKHSLPSELLKDMKPCMQHAVVSTTNVHYSRPPKT